MKPNQLITTMLAVTALFVASCSTPKLAQNNAMQDDVYNTTAKAKEYIAPVIVENTSIENTDDSYYRQSDPYYDMDYSSRIDRFYYGNPNRGYYDPFYNYYGYNNFGYNNFGFNSYAYNSFYSPFNYGFGLNSYFGSYYNNWNNPYYSWGYYGAPYYNNYWGPYAYYNPYGYGGGYYGGGYYGGNVIVGNNENYRPRPDRGSENGTVRADGSIYFPGSTRANNGGNTTSSAPRTRAEMYNPTNNGSSNTPTRSNGTSNAPTRSNSGSNARPTRGNDTQPTQPTQSRPTYTPPPAQQSPPPTQQSSPPPTRGESSSGRPTRGGGR